MFEHGRLQKLDDFFSPLHARSGKTVFFYRLNGYTEEVGVFLKKYYNSARQSGVLIEGKIPNPDQKNLAYYSEIMGMDFRLDPDFISSGLKKWLPRMNDLPRYTVSNSIFSSLSSLSKAGKTENMLKNAYIKFMCWLYYRFERIVNQLGDDTLPKLLYEGTVSNYELMLISILSNAGCDVLLLQHQGDSGYLSLDPGSELSDCLELPGMQSFPSETMIRSIGEEIRRDYMNERLYGIKPAIAGCTNAWITGKWLDDIATPVSLRGNEPGFFYNVFCRINGVEDKAVYANELFLLQQELGQTGRFPVIINEVISRPSPEEIASIRRTNYTRTDQMILELSKNIEYTGDIELKRLIHKAFVDAVLSEASSAGENINRLTNKAVYLLCWLKRYSPLLFRGWKLPQVGCFIYLGGCRDENEALFLRLLSNLPADVLILCPDLNRKCCLQDRLLYEINYSESLQLSRYPESSSQVRIGTAAYHAERELDTLMYRDTGMYRNRQYTKAQIINLQTMYEEIRILWDEDVKYRPGFQTLDGTVDMPVIFSKISGVKDGNVSAYWNSVRELITGDTIVIKSAPYIKPHAPNPMSSHAPGFYKNGRLLKTKIKEHPNFPYSILRDDMQDFILDNLERMISRKLIRGIGENGMEYTVIATVLNLPKDILRMIQKFDFTKKNPKLICINTTESVFSPEDSILMAFLNLTGFDILFFIPTGYQCVEKHFTGQLFEEHQIGDYLYDLTVPDLKALPVKPQKPSWKDRLFGRQ